VEESFGVGGGMQVIAQDADPAGIADLFDLFADALALMPGIFEKVVDFVLEGVELGAPRAVASGEGIFFEGPADGLDVQTSFRAMSFLGSFFGEEEVVNIGPGFRVHKAPGFCGWPAGRLTAAGP